MTIMARYLLMAFKMKSHFVAQFIPFVVNHFKKPPSKIFQKFCVSMEYAIGLCWKLES
jgi:hypothetical protein